MDQAAGSARSRASSPEDAYAALQHANYIWADWLSGDRETGITNPFAAADRLRLVSRLPRTRDTRTADSMSDAAVDGALATAIDESYWAPTEKVCRRGIRPEAVNSI